MLHHSVTDEDISSLVCRELGPMETMWLHYLTVTPIGHNRHIPRRSQFVPPPPSNVALLRKDASSGTAFNGVTTRHAPSQSNFSTHAEGD